MPIGALLGTERVLGEIDDVPTGSTWAWLPGACAAAIATLDVFASEPVLENVAELEAVARRAPRRAARPAPRRIGDVRAEGCFQAIEFVTDRETAEPRLGASARGRRRDGPPRSPRRLFEHLDQHPALAGDAPGGARRVRYDIVGEAIEAALAASR